MSADKILTGDKIIQENFSELNSNAERRLYKLDINIRSNGIDVNVNGSQIKISNLCAINSLIHGMIKLQKENGTMSKIKEICDSTFTEILDAVIQEKEESTINNLIYNFILKNLKDKVFIDKNEINCTMTIFNLIDKVFLPKIKVNCDCKEKNSWYVLIIMIL